MRRMILWQTGEGSCISQEMSQAPGIVRSGGNRPRRPRKDETTKRTRSVFAGWRQHDRVSRVYMGKQAGPIGSKDLYVSTNSWCPRLSEQLCVPEATSNTFL